MAETRALSQWEIDALLNQIPEGTPGPESAAVELAPHAPQREGNLARAIKTYDFRRPDKFSKEQWQTLQAMHETFARLIGSSFSSRLRSLVTARLSSIEQGLYEEWQTQVPNPTSCYVIGVPPLKGSMIVEFNHDVASEVIDRLLGGTGTLVERTRDLTEIELSLLRAFGSTITGALDQMWEKVTPIEAEVQDFALDASLIQVAGPNDVVITAFFEINLGSHLGAMSVCTPYTVVEPVAAKLSAQVWHSSSADVVHDGRVRRQVESMLRRAPLDLAIELGGVSLPVREIVEIEEGDTLVLDAPTTRPLSVTMDGVERFRGRPGLHGRRLAVRITDVIQPPNDNANDEEPVLAERELTSPPLAPPEATAELPSGVTPAPGEGAETVTSAEETANG